MGKQNVSLTVVRRFPRYYRYLNELLKNNITKISSKELSERLGITASQIRQDFNCFGGFGQQGYGYNVESLRWEIANILGINKKKEAVLIGAGNLGHALANNIEFDKNGFVLTGIFDVNPKIIGETIRGVPVTHTDTLEEFCKKRLPDVATITVPQKEAKQTVCRLVKYGVKSFWNFTNVDMHVEGVVFENVHLADSLMTLSYRISPRQD